MYQVSTLMCEVRLLKLQALGLFLIFLSLQFPQNPTNTQMHVSEGPGSTPEISSKANPQFKFPRDFLLNPGPNPVASQEPFGKSKQPTLKIPTGSQLHMGHEKRVDIWNLKARQYNLRSQLKIMSITGHLTSSSICLQTKNASCQFIKSKIVDDEVEKMSLTQSKTNDEKREDNFMAHEQGTQSNSELTHPQMPLSPSMLNQSKMRQQRNQACKAYNVAKSVIQKEKKRWKKAELPENVHGM
ncbi:hypothetical protein O181_024338 [Austropuccinia psidii MF-1]|uniref:Uncharacterized protein n=1 Tax=Austropuccinia psidii MF-1 TaxID=1389203 RepID=A0A9Q3CIT7_9BASI|nr:hypothetical protein [Austropuccinia psidii MF-1]